MRQNMRNIFLLGTLAGACLLTGCGNPVLSDRFVENKGAEAFLDRVAKNCGKLTIGRQQLGYLLDMNSNDIYFIDVSSKLYFGRVDRNTFSSDINAFYPTGDNQAALDCIFYQLNK